MRKITDIVIIGDLLRTQKINPHYSDKNTRFLYELFRGQIAAATGMEPDFELSREPKRFDRARFYSLAGYDAVSSENWIRIASGQYDSKAADYFGECFENSLIISHEAGSLVGVMEQRDIPFIDLRIAPIRFLDDIHFCFRTNLADVAGKILEYVYPEDSIRFAANALKAYYMVRTPDAQVVRRTATSGFPPDSLLICGQTDLDLSLIRDGRAVAFADCAEKMESLVKTYSNIFYKPHPVTAQAADDNRIFAAYPAIKPITGNIYRMLSDDNLVAVAALSSGVLHEAPYFGKQAVAISHLYPNLAANAASAKNDEYVMTGDDYFSPEFWRRILSPCLPVRQCGKTVSSNRVNYLRSRLGMWWGYDLMKDADGDKETKFLSLGRWLVRTIDPRCRMRNALDSSGKIRRSVKFFLGDA